MTSATVHKLRAKAEGLAGKLPAILAHAQHLAATVQLGTHGRKRAGPGDEFWQYRQAQPGDPMRAIDWRRSARSDHHFVQDKEWQAAQTVWIWLDNGRSMQFSSSDQLGSKAHHAAVVALAVAILLVRAGERVGLIGSHSLRPAGGEVQIERLARQLCAPEQDQMPDYGRPDFRAIPRYGRLVLLSDFLAELDPLIHEIDRANAAGLTGTIVQILDPQEIEFPFRGRVIFESPTGQLRHETRQAAALRDAYASKLAQRQLALQSIAQRTGWQYRFARTDGAMTDLVLWLSKALEGPAR